MPLAEGVFIRLGVSVSTLEFVDSQITALRVRRDGLMCILFS